MMMMMTPKTSEFRSRVMQIIIVQRYIQQSRLLHNESIHIKTAVKQTETTYHVRQNERVAGDAER